LRQSPKHGSNCAESTRFPSSRGIAKQRMMSRRLIPMWHHLNLRSRIYLLLVALVVISLLAGSVMVWYTNRVQSLLSNIIDQNVAAFKAAEALQTALVNQKGFVTYFFMDGDPDWLRQLGEHRQIFKDRLIDAQKLAQDRIQQVAVEQISREYQAYIELKDRVIALYTNGDRKQGTELHPQVRSLFADILLQCDRFKEMHFARIKTAQVSSNRTAAQLKIAAVAAIGAHVILALTIAVIFFRQIMVPVTRMLQAMGHGAASEESGNIVATLNRNVIDLLQNVDQAQIELEKSREHLLQTEKMAMVGRLAAGMAHTIRNPFTSVKMRLFSLGRSLTLSEPQKDDFEVISHEIRHIDAIVQNFLEFSRPPKLVLQPVSPSVIVDNAIKLLVHRLKSYDVAIQVQRRDPLPEIIGDSEQLKEVLVNLIVNACEAMEDGGSIRIEETIHDAQVVLRVCDSGPGIAPAIMDKIFHPFFTTKEDGTGLGLSIARRIVEEHGGSLEIASHEAKGAAFVITLPIKEN